MFFAFRRVTSWVQNRIFWVSFFEHFSVTNFVGLGIDFGSLLGVQIGHFGHRFLHVVPRSSQERPRAAQEPPKRPKRDPQSTQKASKSTQKGTQEHQKRHPNTETKDTQKTNEKQTNDRQKHKQKDHKYEQNTDKRQTRWSRPWACFVELIRCSRPWPCFGELKRRFPFSAAQVFGKVSG